MRDDEAIVILTGAGISKESGLATFRDKDGIWAKIRLEDVATPEAFARDPVTVQEFYNQRRRQLLSPEILPNAAHFALARLQNQFPDRVVIVTQNIDDLHERAGANPVWHMHGELLKARCAGCGSVQPCTEDLGPGSRCRSCGATGRLRPHVVWFGEIPLFLEDIEAAVYTCSRFVAIGTSGNVYPAAGLIQIAKAGGARTLELNLEPGKTANIFDEHRFGPATEVVPAWVDELLAGQTD